MPALVAGMPPLNEDCINSCKYPRVFGTPAIVTVSGKRKQLHTRQAFGAMQLPPKATQSQVISCSNSTAPEALLPQVPLFQCYQCSRHSLGSSPGRSSLESRTLLLRNNCLCLAISFPLASHHPCLSGTGLMAGKHLTHSSESQGWQKSCATSPWKLPLPLPVILLRPEIPKQAGR